MDVSSSTNNNYYTAPTNTPSTLNITSSTTINGLKNLSISDEPYTVESLMNAVPTLSEGNAQELIAKFDTDGDGKLNETETDVMKSVIGEAVADGKFKDHKLTWREVSPYFNSKMAQIAMDRASRSLDYALGTKTKTRSRTKTKIITLNNLMAAAPKLSKSTVSDLIKLFDTDGDGKIDEIEIVKMKEFIVEAIVYAQSGKAGQVSMKDFLSYLRMITNDDLRDLLDKEKNERSAVGQNIEDDLSTENHLPV